MTSSTMSRAPFLRLIWRKPRKSFPGRTTPMLAATGSTMMAGNFAGVFGEDGFNGGEIVVGNVEGEFGEGLRDAGTFRDTESGEAGSHFARESCRHAAADNSRQL